MTLKLEIRRTLKAPQKQVFEAFTEADILKRWFAPGDMTVPRAELDKRRGGSYLIEMRDPAGESHVVTGVIREYKPYEMLSVTWKWSGPDAVETLVTFTFRDKGGETEVVLVHENFLTAEARDKHRQGWEGCLNNFGKFLRLKTAAASTPSGPCPTAVAGPPIRRVTSRRLTLEDRHSLSVAPKRRSRAFGIC